MKLSVDALVARDNVVFGYGWAFDQAADVNEIQFRLNLLDGTSVVLPVSYGRPRPDVARAFAAIPFASNSGWMIYAAWKGAPIVGGGLTGKLADGRLFDHPLPERFVNHESPRNGWSALYRRLLQANFFKRSSLLERAVPIEEVSPVLLRIRERLIESKQSHCTLVLDHDMGGGANHYSQRWIQQDLKRRPLLLRLTFEINTLNYLVDLIDSEGKERHRVSVSQIQELLTTTGCVDHVFYNDAVSFPHPDEVPQWLQSFRRRPGTRLSIAVHDYFSVCPSQFLLNDAGKFCGIPTMQECQRCLPANENEFSGLFVSQFMPLWRERWGAALGAADEIICFSESSRKLLHRAYPALVDSPVHVRPHPVQRFSRLPSIDVGAALHLGVVGAIGIHKGARILQSLADEIVSRGLPIQITVIGTLELPCNPSVVRCTGSFEREALPALIEESGANLFMLPSICPETFSYVTQELISLEVPVVCFDLGAPADRVAAYARGRVLPLENARSLLNALLQFHRELVVA